MRASGQEIVLMIVKTDLLEGTFLGMVMVETTLKSKKTAIRSSGLVNWLKEMRGFKEILE